tara:strand:- start:1415 stop:2329 length:915 start_codon:yes stop_codon:yes gene_type:complete
MSLKLVIGSRGSRLAIEQSNIVKESILNLKPDVNVSIKIIKTKGDILLSQSVQHLVDKGFFVNEIQRELVNKKIDISVHSLKDLPTKNEKNISINSILKREDSRDVFISKDNLNPHQIPDGSIIATSSNRRKYQLLKINPTFKVIEIRGNVDTRIKKWQSGYCDALVLAYAGIKRLNLSRLISYVFSYDEMLPAAGQGAIAIETRSDDFSTKKIVKNINCSLTEKCVLVERGVLNKLGLGCNAPIAVNVNVTDNVVRLKLMIFSISKMKHISLNLERDVTEIGLLVDEVLSKLNKMDFKKILNE